MRKRAAFTPFRKKGIIYWFAIIHNLFLFLVRVIEKNPFGTARFFMSKVVVTQTAHPFPFAHVVNLRVGAQAFEQAECVRALLEFVNTVFGIVEVSKNNSSVRAGFRASGLVCFFRERERVFAVGDSLILSFHEALVAETAFFDNAAGTGGIRRD